MKKIVFVFLMVVVFGGFHVFAQNNYTSITLDGVVINLPKQYNEFVEINANQREYLKVQTHPFNSLLAVFLDTIDVKKYLNNVYTIKEMDKYIAIWVNSAYERKNYKENLYPQLNKLTISNLTDNNKQRIDNSNSVQYESFINKRIFKPNNTELISYIFDSNIASGFLYVYFKSNKSEKTKILITRNIILVKNRIFDVYISCIYDGYNSINWITDVSKNYILNILEANK